MLARSSRVPLVSIVVAGLAAFVISFITTFLIVGVYAFVLAFQARGAPDPAKINAFANQFAPFLSPLVLSIVVIAAAYRVVKRAQAPQIWYGALVGIIAAVPTAIFARSLTLIEVISLVLPVVGGVLGAYLATRPQRVSQ